MGQQESFYCKAETTKKSAGVFSGILFGLLPHSFCILFILFSIIGAVTISGFLKKFLLIPNLFFLLIVISVILATAFSMIYLKRNNCICPSGLKNKWKYIATVYTTTTLVNLMMFFIVFPTLANINFRKESGINTAIQNQKNNLSELTINVQIPCSGHAPLIIDEIKKNCDVQSIAFSMPNTFNIKYDPQKTSPEKIASLEIFKTYEATIN